MRKAPRRRVLRTETADTIILQPEPSLDHRW